MEIDINKEFEEYQEYLEVSSLRLKYPIKFESDDELLDDLIKELKGKEIEF